MPSSARAVPPAKDEKVTSAASNTRDSFLEFISFLDKG
jgi:hypothetical protein